MASRLASQSSWTLGTKRLLYYRVRFQDDTQDPVTALEAEADLDQGNRILRRMSYGSYGFTWTVTPILPLVQTSQYYGERGFEVLLEDAHRAAQAAGFNYLDYDLDVVRHNSVPGFSGGHGNLGRRGAWLQVGGAAVLAHELGHNLGLAHANFWDTATPDSSPKISPPFPSNVNEGREGHAFDADSLIGHDSAIGPGQSREYGDIFDLMGTGGETSDFNAAYKQRLGWLSGNQVLGVTQSGVYRVYAFDVDQVQPNRSYALRIGGQPWIRSIRRPYWVQYRINQGRSNWLQNGLQLLWGDGPLQQGSTQLIDTTPGTSSRQLDSPLSLGRTFSDPLIPVHITPLTQGSLGGERWMDVAVHFGDAPSSTPPTLSLVAENLSPEPMQNVRFEARIAGSSQEPWAYFWDFGDDTPSANSNVISKSWPYPGEFVVRCEASNTRGLKTSQQVLVRVGAGSAALRHISGRVVDSTGQPVAGARVHNGQLFRNPQDSPYAWTYTDSEGDYTLANLKDGTYTNGAFLFGYSIRAAGSNSVAVVQGSSISNFNFVALPLPRVHVRLIQSGVEEGDSAEFEFTRTGSSDKPMTVLFSVSGTARAREDYVSFFLNQVTIPAGSASVRLPLFTIRDELAEAPETVIISLEYPTASKRLFVENGATNEITVFFPGWELRPQGGEMKWTQTDPDYIIDSQSIAALTIRDTGADQPILSLTRLEKRAVQLNLQGRSGATYLLQISGDLLHWEPFQTNTLTGASWTIPLSSRADHIPVFFRALWLNGN